MPPGSRFSAVWLISKLQPEYLEASNPETLPFGNFHILHIQMKRHTHTHTRACWKWKQLQSRSSRRTRRLSSQLCTPNRIVKLYWLSNTWTQANLKRRTLVCACMHTKTSGGTKEGQWNHRRTETGPKDVNCTFVNSARSREASWPFEPFRIETPQPCFSCSREDVQLIIVVRERLCSCF